MKHQRPYVILGLIGLTIKLASQLIPFNEGIGDAAGWLLVILAIRSLVKEKILYILLTFFVGLSINNLFDEIFFDPTKLQWNEAIFALIGLIWLIYKTTKKWREKN